MKKLLSTTAILGALALSAGTAEAANLQVNVGGFLDFQAGYTNDDIVGQQAAGNGANNHDNVFNFNQDTEVHFTVEGTADNGLQYGAVIELEADVANTDSRHGGLNADKAYLFGQGGWGRVELGANTDSSQALSVNTATFASATGGVDGDFYRYTLAPANFSGIVRPELPIANQGDNTAGLTAFNAGGNTTAATNEDATKITYYSPRLFGFQVGASYIPNSQAVGYTQPSVAGFENVVTAGLNFTGQYDQVGVKASVTGQHGTNKEHNTGGRNDPALNAWNAGANVSFAGFTVGGSYGDYGNSLDTAAAGNARSATYYDLGAGYALGPWSASATYFHSSVDTQTVASNEDKFRNIVVGTDYKLAPGLVPYAEVSFFDFNGVGSGIANDNSGTAVIVGTQLTF